MDWIASLQATLPELVLSVGALALMLVAAWGGQASTRAVSWTSVAVLIGAGIALCGPASYAGVVFDGLYRADAFAAFAKALIYIAAAVSIIIAPRFFARCDGDSLHPEYPVLILLSAAGMGMMVSAGDLLTLYVGLELQSLAAYVLASFMRRDQLRDGDKVRSQALGRDEFVAQAPALLAEIQQALYDEAKARLVANIRTDLTSFDQVAEYFGAVSEDEEETAAFKGWVRAPWSRPTGAALDEIEQKLKAYKLTLRNAPADQPSSFGACIFSGTPGVEEILIGRAY